MRILVAEDDPRSLEFVTAGLTESGYHVDAVPDGAVALEFLSKHFYDLVILDVMMPHKDGWEVLQQLRAHGVKSPVLFLTAKDTVEDRVKGLELGADDYLVKPFAWAELLARVRTLLRRATPRQAEVLQIANLELDLSRMKAYRDGRVIDLTAKEFQVLTLLVRHRGEIVTRATLAEQVWNMPHFVESNAVDVALGRLRKKVDDPFDHKLIQTIRGVGYLLEENHHV